MTVALDVDHIIAVHDLRRPVVRAVGSTLNGTRAAVRVTVVCHNLAASAVAAALGAHADDERLRLVELDDPIPSPSGPFNLGLDAATARFTSIMGSDDELEPGAIDSWLRVADRTGSDVVIARASFAGGGRVFTPPVRLGRRRGLDGRRDRLAYRSAPLGLVSRARFGDLRFPPGFASGEDVEYVTRLWYSRARIAFDARGPAYLVHDDAPVRVSTATKPVTTDAAFLAPLLEGDAFRSLDRGARDALVTKILRGNILQWIRVRADSEWSDADVEALHTSIRQCAVAAPHAFAPLSRTDRDILDAFAAVDPRPAHAVALVRQRTSLRPRNLLPRSWTHALAREAPLRYALASTAVSRLR